jgi:ribosomal protein L37AE/L43A
MSAIVDNLNKHINKFIKIQLPDDMVVDEGKEKVMIKILEYLNKIPGMTLTTFLLSITTLDKNVEWVWKTSRGTLTKRIAAALYKEHKIKLEPAILSEIGTMLKNYHVDKQNLLCDFVPLKPEMKWWDRGTFEDSNSCFWSERNGARDLMANNGFWCFRVWSEKAKQALRDKPELTPTELILTKDKDYGMARAWMFPHKNNIVMFNGYARNNPALQNNPLLQLTRIASLHLGTSYKEIGFYNHGASDGLLYINNSGRGYVLGEQSAINGIKEIDADAREDHYRNHICDICHESRTDDRMPDDRWVCEECQEECYTPVVGRNGLWDIDDCTYSEYHEDYVHNDDVRRLPWSDEIYACSVLQYDDCYGEFYLPEHHNDLVDYFAKQEA